MAVKLFNKFLRINLDDVAEMRDYKTLNEWYVKLSGKILELKIRQDEEDSESLRKILANANAFLKTIKKQRRNIYREKLISMGYIPDTEEDVFERSVTRCFQEIAKNMLPEDVYGKYLEMATEMAREMKDKAKMKEEELMDS